MSSELHFPNRETVVEFLSTYHPLNNPYFKKKGITRAVAKFAAERFADSRKPKMSIHIGVMMMVSDLRYGIDGFSRKRLLNLSKMSHRNTFWGYLSKHIEKALVDCAKESEHVAKLS